MPVYACVWVNDFFLASPALPCPRFPVHQRNPRALPAPPAPSLQRFWPRPPHGYPRPCALLPGNPRSAFLRPLTATRLFARASPSTPSAPLNSAATSLTACLSPIHQRQCPSQRPRPTHFLNPHHAYLLVPFWAPRAFSTWRNDLRERIPSLRESPDIHRFYVHGFAERAGGPFSHAPFLCALPTEDFSSCDEYDDPPPPNDDLSSTPTLLPARRPIRRPRTVVDASHQVSFSSSSSPPTAHFSHRLDAVPTPTPASANPSTILTVVPVCSTSCNYSPLVLPRRLPLRPSRFSRLHPEQ
ncbi:hypothetical protein B0H13DRAFT_2357434 [Mycena leptocephala]|nr:hypothetical protein B0H13DRAFT_2357434 [Mycena leptocephala]